MSEISTTNVRSLIHRTDPYAGFSVEGREPDTQGWGSNHQIFEVAIKKKKPRLIVEVGTWKGGSALHMAGLCKGLGLDTEIVCVDTWLGSSNIYTRKDDPYYDSLKHTNGYPRLYETFLTNVVHCGHSDVITPLALPSQLAAEVLTHFKVKADLIYIDAAHDYRSTLLDLQSFWPILQDDGVLIGDDYFGWPGVTKAANQFAAETGRPIYATNGKFLIPKGKFEIKVSYS